MYTRYKKWLFIVVILTISFILPYFYTNRHVLHLLVLAGIYAVYGMSLDLMIGYTNLFSLAHGALAGIGAYSSALLCISFGVPIPLGIIFAAVVAAAIGFLLGLISLRLKGHFFAILTICFQMVIYLVLSHWYGLTRGSFGLTGVPSLGPVQVNFVVIMFLSVFVAIFLKQLVDSPVGLELKALRDNEQAAECMGISYSRGKIFAFTVSAAVAGIAGGFYAHYMRNIHPVDFNIWSAIIISAIVLVGGKGTLFGSIIGAVLLIILPEYLRVAQELRILLYGFALLIIPSFMPLGIVGTVAIFSKKLKKKFILQ